MNTKKIIAGAGIGLVLAGGFALMTDAKTTYEKVDEFTMKITTTSTSQSLVSREVLNNAKAELATAKAEAISQIAAIDQQIAEIDKLLAEADKLGLK